MKRVQSIALLFVMLLGMLFNFSPVLASTPDTVSGAQTYVVLVGAEDARNGVEVNKFFPDKVTIHVGDSVEWRQNSYEIHTVSFLNGGPIPEIIVPVDPSLNAPSPLMLNPEAALPNMPANGQYDGSTVANSGIMGKDPGQAGTFKLTFTRAGTYEYVCIIHGMMMSGKVTVVDSAKSILSPGKVQARGKAEVKMFLKYQRSALQLASLQVPQPDQNEDGTTTHHILMGSMIGPFDLMRFIPASIVVHPGDTIVWSFGNFNEAPHTVTFLNGAEDPSLITPFSPPGSQGAPLLLINPEVLTPANADQPLNASHMVNSGLLVPGNPQGPQTFSLTVDPNFTGKLTYICILHDESGMVGTIVVKPR